MSDIYSLYGEDGWGPALSALARNKIPDKETILRALRGEQPIPNEVRQHLADLIEGKIKRPRGRSFTSAEIAGKLFRDEAIRRIYRFIIDDIRQIPADKRASSTPSEKAFAEVARIAAKTLGIHLSESQIRGIVYDKNLGIQKSHSD